MSSENKYSAPPTLQEAIDKAGSPMKLLWKPTAPAWTVPVVKPEYVGWSQEQRAWRETAALSDLSHHMFDLFMEGPDATRLLKAVGANDFESFEIGRAKQFVPVTAEGYIVTDGILLREGPEKYTLSGVPASQTWVRYHGTKGGYDVSFTSDPDSSVRKNGDPVLFRYQVQGPRALDVVERTFGGPIPKTKFFHSTPVSLGGRSFRALRHGMAGQAGYEFIGDWKDAAYVKDALMKAGEPSGLVHVGGLAYSTNGIESGWIPTPTVGIFTAPALEEYRRSISLFSYEGQKPLHGSFFSENIEDYYTSPFELGYGKSIAFNHDFIGREALEAAQDRVRRTKVTLVVDPEDARQVFGANPDFFLTYGRYRVEAGSALVGMTFYTAFIGPVGTVLALSLVDKQYAEPGTQVTLVWGEHPGSGTAPDADLGFVRLRATVQPSPYNEHAREKYRKDL
jgi:vanillate/3-O-methylgallate O-demethylase